MLVYLLKSIVGAGILFGFYHLLLRKSKTLIFNRFFLIFSLIFPIILPFISLPFSFNLFGRTAITGFADGSGLESFKANFFNNPILKMVIFILYSLVSLILIIRFALNLIRIGKIIAKSRTEYSQKYRVVLVEEKIMPFSFWRNIFVNRIDFETKKINLELVRHEQAHCRQLHSLDIIFSEFIKSIMWINPIIWMIGKDIQLNHEYLADSEALLKTDLQDYQKSLINYVFRNNSIQLVSNFYCSFTKNRLKMMELKSPKNVIFNKLAVIPLLIIMVFFIANCNEKEVLAKKNSILEKSKQEQKVTKEMYQTKEIQEAIAKGEIPPPPPPPPPADKKKEKKEFDGDFPPPPPPPPPPSSEKK